MASFSFLSSLSPAAPHRQWKAEMPGNTEMAHSVPLTSKKLKERCYWAWSLSGGWRMALSSLIVLPSSTEKEQISARTEWCVWPLHLSYNVPGSLMWLSFRCTADTEKGTVYGQITRLIGIGRLEGEWGDTKSKRKCTRDGGWLVWHWESEKRDLSLTQSR